MKLNFIYSYELNTFLNCDFSEDENLKNFTSLLTDRERFESVIKLIEKNKKIIEKYLGFNLEKEYDIYVVRAEKFKSISPPIIIEYSILPEEMTLYTLKEIVKSSGLIFQDEVSREEILNSFITKIIIEGDFENYDLIKHLKPLHDFSGQKFENYSFEKSQKINFDNRTLKEKLEKDLSFD